MDLKDIIISVAVPLVVACVSWLGSQCAVKINKAALENLKEATPPELLRLEKWSTILKDSNDYRRILNIIWIWELLNLPIMIFLNAPLLRIE